LDRFSKERKRKKEKERKKKILSLIAITLILSRSPFDCGFVCPRLTGHIYRPKKLNFGL